MQYNSKHGVPVEIWVMLQRVEGESAEVEKTEWENAEVEN